MQFNRKYRTKNYRAFLKNFLGPKDNVMCWVGVGDTKDDVGGSYHYILYFCEGKLIKDQRGRLTIS